MNIRVYYKLLLFNGKKNICAQVLTNNMDL